MPTTEFSVNKRDIQFVLHEQLGTAELCDFPVFGECNRELFEMVLGEAIKIATDVLAPINKVGDRIGAQYQNGAVRMPDEFKAAYGKFVEGGWIGMVHDPECGGQGLPNLLKYATSEIFAGANVAFYLTHTLTEGAAHLIERFGTDELRKLYVEKMYVGEWSGSMCLTEPSAGSDVGNLKTIAKPNGDHYLISGNKIFITAGEHDMAPNIIHAVLARIEGAPAGTKGISLFLVPKVLVDAQGNLTERNDMSCGNIEHKMGMKASPTCTLNFGDEGRCKGWLLGDEHQGMALMFQMMNEERLMVGMQGLALGSVAYQSALGYAQERAQGDAPGSKDPAAARTPIINHPDVRRMLMWMKSMTEGLRSMMFSVAKSIDLATHHPDEAVRARHDHLVELLTPVCKAYGSDMGFRVNELAIQTFGGYGYCQEYPVEQYCRDQKIASIYEGTNGIQAMDLLGRKIARNGGEYLKEFLGDIVKLSENNKKSDVLGACAGQLLKAVEAITRSATDLATGLKKDPAYSLLQASPFLEAFGHLAVAYFLVDAAVVAQDKLAGIVQKAGAKDAAARASLLAENPEAAFYHGRVASARFFCNHILPHVHANVAAMGSGDHSALEAVFPG
jgi:alkylation response protein AidB-like acyl-CoA dehydrogenase